MSDKQHKVKSFQETNEEMNRNDELKHRQPTPQPKEIEEIDY